LGSTSAAWEERAPLLDEKARLFNVHAPKGPCTHSPRRRPWEVA